MAKKSKSAETVERDMKADEQAVAESVVAGGRFEPEMAIELIDESPTNPRKTFDNLDELAESISKMGVVQPLLLRPAPSSKDRFELVAGARRLRASKRAGRVTVPAIVRELSDRDALLVQLVENKERNDVPPLEEAEHYARCIAEGIEAATIAAKLGRSESYVVQRLQLRHLVSPARKLLDEETIGLGHAMELARLPNDRQLALVEDIASQLKFGRSPTVAELRRHIARDAMRPLSAGRWKKDDADLLPEAGPCTTCPKNTACQPALFAELDPRQPTCTDPSCFEAKAERFVQVQLQRIELESGQPPVALTNAYASDKLKQQYGDVRGTWSVERITAKQAKKLKPEEYRRALVIDGDDAGETVLIRVEAEAEKKRKQQDRQKDRLRREEAARERRRKLEITVRERLLDRILHAPAMERFETQDFRRLVRWAWHRCGSESQKLVARRREWPRDKRRYGISFDAAANGAIDAAGVDELHRLVTEIMLVGQCRISHYMPVEQANPIADLARDLGIDEAELRDKVKAEQDAKKTKSQKRRAGVAA